jgi:hypothetical protein
MVILTLIPASAMLSPMTSLIQTGSGMIPGRLDPQGTGLSAAGLATAPYKSIAAGPVCLFPAKKRRVPGQTYLIF